MLAAVLAAAVCHVGGVAPFVRPDPVCTPGAYENLTRTEVCIHKERPDLPFYVRRKILEAYGVPSWSGRDGELDHRQPFALGGTTDARNIWPEVGRIPNAKDQLEFYVYGRVCRRKPYPMRLTTAHRIFAGDWVLAYRKYIGPTT